MKKHQNNSYLSWCGQRLCSGSDQQEDDGTFWAVEGRPNYYACTRADESELLKCEYLLAAWAACLELHLRPVQFWIINLEIPGLVFPVGEPGQTRIWKYGSIVGKKGAGRQVTA